MQWISAGRTAEGMGTALNGSMQGETAQLALGQAIDAARCVEAQAGPWLQDFERAMQNGLEWQAWDRYGRWLGRVRWRQDGNSWVLEELQAPRGALWRLRRHLRDDVARLGTLRLQLGPRQRSADRLLRALGATEPARSLHPVLAGKATEHTTELVERAQAFGLLARNPRHASLALSTLLTRIRRAQGAGQLRLWHDVDGRPHALLIWARPDEAWREALIAGQAPALHAAEWNAGGSLALLDFCARDAQGAERLAAAIDGLVAPHEAQLFIRLAQGERQAELRAVPRAEWPALQAWLRTALSAELIS
jgi:hemolysin-activating ACP:hemolysin acyltransferase